MKYISVEQFRSAGEKVTKCIMEWWEPEENDLVKGVSGTHFLGDGFVKGDIWVSGIGSVPTERIKGYIPLLTTSHLIDFIEWRTGYAIEKIEYGPADCYWIQLFDDFGCDSPRWVKEEMSFNDKELIQALWKCACEVATDTYYDKTEESRIKHLFNVIERLEDAGMLDVEIEVYTDGEYKTVEDLVNSLEDELSYAAESCE